MADPINEFIEIMRQEGKFHNEPSFFIGKVKNKLPDLKIETNNIILEKEDILIDSWMLDRQIELFDTETSQEHKHEIKNPFIDTFESGDTVIMFKIGERNEAIKVWIYKTIKTDKYVHLIYDWDYGTDIKNLIGQKYTKGLTESEAKRYIQEALLTNPYILEVNVTNTEFKDDNLSISLNVKTIYGEEEITFV